MLSTLSLRWPHIGFLILFASGTLLCYTLLPFLPLACFILPPLFLIPSSLFLAAPQKDTPASWHSILIQPLFLLGCSFFPTLIVALALTLPGLASLLSAIGAALILANMYLKDPAPDSHREKEEVKLWVFIGCGLALLAYILFQCFSYSPVGCLSAIFLLLAKATHFVFLQNREKDSEVDCQKAWALTLRRSIFCFLALGLSFGLYSLPMGIFVFIQHLPSLLFGCFVLPGGPYWLSALVMNTLGFLKRKSEHLTEEKMDSKPGFLEVHENIIDFLQPQAFLSHAEKQFINEESVSEEKPAESATPR